MEAQNGPHIAAFQLFFIVSRTQERQHHTVRAKGRFNHIGHIFLPLAVIKITHILTGHFLMSGQVIVCPVRDTPQLSPAEGE